MFDSPVEDIVVKIPYFEIAKVGACLREESA
jgi:hypothetical protein